MADKPLPYPVTSTMWAAVCPVLSQFNNPAGLKTVPAQPSPDFQHSDGHEERDTSISFWCLLLFSASS